MADSLPKTFKAAVFEKVGAPLTIKELPLQLPKEGELLVKVLACGVCHSDMMVQSGELGNPLSVVDFETSCVCDSLTLGAQPEDSRPRGDW